ncbi:MAG: hypothetical protein BMS9Abin36_2212 [Gammaproteobacteria bacterium]|nr:MAG: hypothetical protein BMS9Abin36_2212 [Gammaproteobacteria bacterium]
MQYSIVNFSNTHKISVTESGINQRAVFYFTRGIQKLQGVTSLKILMNHLQQLSSGLYPVIPTAETSDQV